MTVRRYSDLAYGGGLYEDRDGNYVKYEDYEELQSELDTDVEPFNICPSCFMATAPVPELWTNILKEWHQANWRDIENYGMTEDVVADFISRAAQAPMPR